MLEFINSILDFTESILYYPLGFGIPFLVVWLVFGGVFFSFRLGFINLRLFKHGVQCAMGKYSKTSDPGLISPRQALVTSISATVGLGNIAGVAVAISIGGPGSVFWMVLMGFLGMSTVFAESVMGQKYRIFEKDGNIKGGPFQYLKSGLSDLNLPKLGKFLSICFSLCLLIGVVPTVMFQSNQTTAAIASLGFDFNAPLVTAVIITALTGFVLIGRITRIAKITEILIPTMAITYIVSSFTIIIYHYQQLPEALNLILSSAFDFKAANGGMIGAIIGGVKRAAFSNEAGLGTTSIANSAAKSREPVRQASIAMLTPFIDTVIFCFVTGVVITITGTYANTTLKGVDMTNLSFQSVVWWFPYILTFAVSLFAFSTIISYGYYGEAAWLYFFKKKSLNLYFLLFCIAIFTACFTPLDTIVRLGDNFLLMMAIPNLIGLYLLSPIIKRETQSYLKRFLSK